MGHVCRECTDSGPFVCQGSEDPIGIGFLSNIIRHALCKPGGRKLFGYTILSPSTCRASEKYKKNHDCIHVKHETEYKTLDLVDKIKYQISQRNPQTNHIQSIN